LADVDTLEELLVGVFDVGGVVEVHAGAVA